MSPDTLENTPASINRTRPQIFAVVIAASFAAALMLALIACSLEAPTPTSTPAPTSTSTPRPTATREPLDPDVRYYLPGQVGNEFRTYATAIAEGVPPEEADRYVEAWMMVREGHKGSREVVDFLLTAGISENAILVEDVSPCYIYVIARVPVSLLRPLSEHPYMLILTLGPTPSAETVSSKLTPSAVAASKKPVCLPAATPPAGAAGTAQEPLKPVQKYGLTGPPFFELDIYLDAIARGVTPENANKKVDTWIRVRDDAGTRAVSEFLLANGVSEDSLRTEQHGRHFRYVISQVPVPLLIPLSAHPHALHVGDRIPTEVPKEVSPTGSIATPAPAPTPSDAARWHRTDSWHDAGYRGRA